MREQRGALHKKEPSKTSMKDINKLRRKLGLEGIEVKTRRCLKCDKDFRSISFGNRICENCVRYNPIEADGGVRLYDKIRFG